MSYLVKAIQLLRPTAEFSIIDNDYSRIKWDVLDADAPTQKEIDIAIKEVKANELNKAKSQEASKKAILDRIGLTADELQIILG